MHHAWERLPLSVPASCLMINRWGDQLLRNSLQTVRIANNRLECNHRLWLQTKPKTQTRNDHSTIKIDVGCGRPTVIIRKINFQCC